MKNGKKKQSNVFKICLLILGIVILSICIDGASAADHSDIYVSTHGNDAWDGLSASYNTSSGSGPKATINDAKNTVSTSGTVHIANGTYYQHNIMINDDVTITVKVKKIR